MWDVLALACACPREEGTERSDSVAADRTEGSGIKGRPEKVPLSRRAAASLDDANVWQTEVKRFYPETGAE